MDVKLYNFPTLADGRIAVETQYCDFLTRYRAGESLDPEILDWMDTANNWLTSTGSKL